MKISQSEEIKELVSSLAKAQGSMKPAVFNKINPHFKSRYADFASCMDACRIPLSENGIAIIQYCETVEGKLNLITMLAHTSGQWMKSEFPLISAKMDSQGIGSAMTYAKRYSLCGMVGIVADEDGDDDAETAVGRGQHKYGNRPNDNYPQKVSSLKISKEEANVLNDIRSKLDDECKGKINKWILSSFKTESIENLPFGCFNKVLPAFQNALKFMEQQKLEVVNA